MQLTSLFAPDRALFSFKSNKNAAIRLPASALWKGKFATNHWHRNRLSQIGVCPDRECELRSLVILMIEEEQPEGLSARKLVVETVKHNVLTAYNAKEGFDLLKRFPNVDAILVHSRELAKRPSLLTEVRSLVSGQADHSCQSVCRRIQFRGDFRCRQP